MKISRRTFWVAMVVIVAVGGGIRLWHLFNTKWDTPIAGDAKYYHEQANLLAEGKGYIDPFAYAEGVTRPSAVHPPLYPTVLAGFSAVGLDTQNQHRLITVVMGTGAIVVIGLLGRKLAGDLAGLVAAGFAAVAPNLWSLDAQALSESLFAALIAAFLLAVYRLREAPSWGRAATAGALAALCALTRSEALLLFLLVLVPVFWGMRTYSWQKRVQFGAVAALVGALLTGPWVVRNLVAFDRPVLMTTNEGITIAYTNCDSAYNGTLAGYWDMKCAKQFPATTDESIVSEENREQGIDYARAHAGELPRVAAIRFLRVWNLYNTEEGWNIERLIEGRTQFVAVSGTISLWLSMIASVWGVFVLRRRRVPVYPLLAVVILVTVTAVIFYGVVRFRVPADVVLVVLSAVAAADVVDRIRRRRVAASEIDLAAGGGPSTSADPVATTMAPEGGA